MKSLDKFLARFLPFVFIGIAIAVGILFFTVMAYIMLIGIVLGLFLYLIVFVKDKFFSKKSQKHVNIKSKRTFDYDDFDK